MKRSTSSQAEVESSKEVWISSNPRLDIFSSHADAFITYTRK